MIRQVVTEILKRGHIKSTRTANGRRRNVQGQPLGVET